ncbi:MAG TPA: hypothetical protein VL754_16985 [Verrucomicrobiae bacterium]|jgi:hypothetical protein|nr:hypothetical protein [Verrucomicrobiae bacterium]
MSEFKRGEELDTYLLQVVQALHLTVNHGITRLNDAKEADRALEDCDHILAVILAGQVSDWLS